MKRNSLMLCVAFIVGVVFSSNVLAQTIEVVVEEDVKVQAVSFTYSISLEDGLSAALLGMYMEDEGEGEDLELEGMTSEEIQDMLKKEGFSFKLSSESNYELSEHNVPSAILVDLKSKKELDRLYGLLEEMTYLNGKISDATFEDVEKYHEEVFTALTKKAKDKASLLAKSAGKELGAVVSIEEGGQDDPFASLMSQYSRLMRSITTTSLWFTEDNMSKTITVKMVYTFELK